MGSGLRLLSLLCGRRWPDETSKSKDESGCMKSSHSSNEVLLNLCVSDLLSNEIALPKNISSTSFSYTVLPDVTYISRGPLYRRRWSFARSLSFAIGYHIHTREVATHLNTKEAVVGPYHSPTQKITLEIT